MSKTGEDIFSITLQFYLNIFLVITFKYWFSLSKKLPLPPAPFSWPLIGNIFQVDRRRPHASFSKASSSSCPWFNVHKVRYTFRGHGFIPCCCCWGSQNQLSYALRTIPFSFILSPGMETSQFFTRVMWWLLKKYLGQSLRNVMIIGKVFRAELFNSKAKVSMR